MLRIAKLTDYGVTLATRMAAAGPLEAYSVQTLSRVTAIPPTTVSKLCKLLAGVGVLVSRRGAHGGYRLSQAPSRISLARVIEAIEGPIGVTECARERGICEYARRCTLQSQWRQISKRIAFALDGISLAAMAESASPPLGQAPGNVRPPRCRKRVSEPTSVGSEPPEQGLHADFPTARSNPLQ
jgi:FeS assembly SUF system regulator